MKTVEELKRAAREYADQQYPGGWESVGITVRGADGGVILYVLVEPGRSATLSRGEVARSLPSGGRVP